MSNRAEDMQFYEWLFGRRDTPIIKSDMEVKMPDTVYVCLDCGQVNTYFTTCESCEEKAAYHENN